MRLGVVLVLVLGAPPALAKPMAQDTADWLLAHPDAQAFAGAVDLGATAFDSPACAQRFAKPELVGGGDLDQLAGCILPFASIYTLGDRTIALRGDLAYELSLVRGRITAIRPVGGGDEVTTDRGVDTRFVPSARVRAALDDTAGAEAVVKVCRDRVRVLAHSRNDAFDREADAYARELAPAGCAIVALRYPAVDLDTGLDATPPPHEDVTEAALLARQLAGERHVEPDDATKTEIMRAGRVRLVGVVDTCIDTRGVVTSLAVERSTGFPAFDGTLQYAMRAWRFEPFARAACAPITFVYVQL